MKEVIMDIFDYNGHEIKQTYIKGCPDKTRDENLRELIVKRFGKFDRKLLNKKDTKSQEVDETKFGDV